jgi:hypothetical protein
MIDKKDYQDFSLSYLKTELGWEKIDLKNNEEILDIDSKALEEGGCEEFKEHMIRNIDKYSMRISENKANIRILERLISLKELDEID